MGDDSDDREPWGDEVVIDGRKTAVACLCAEIPLWLPAGEDVTWAVPPELRQTFDDFLGQR